MPSIIETNLILRKVASKQVHLFFRLSAAASTRGGSRLGLRSLLFSLSLGLLLLSFLYALLTSGLTGFRAHVAAFTDLVERSTDDGTVRLDMATAALLGYFLLREKKKSTPSVNYPIERLLFFFYLFHGKIK